MLSVLVQEQNRAKQPGKLGFHNPHQLLQYFLERCIAHDHLQDTTLSGTQPLCPLLFGHVHQRTHEFNHIAGCAEDWVTYCVDISDLAAGMNDSAVQLELRPFAPCSLQRFHGPGLIIRMYALKDCFESWQPTLGVKTQHAVTFL